MLGRLLEQLPPESQERPGRAPACQALRPGRHHDRAPDQSPALALGAVEGLRFLARTTINELWQAGLEDVRQSVAKVDLLKPRDAGLGMRVYDLTR